MTCYHPLTAYVDLEELTGNGKRKICFSTPKGFDQYEEIKLPCGQCIGCRLDRSRSWAVRCVHESLLTNKACFITLTYNDEHLPSSGDLKDCKRDFVLFMKRLRKKFGKGIRFFHCGEYGEKLGRPHHHVILFGIDFLDVNCKVPIKRTKLGHFLYTCYPLTKLWSDRSGKPIGFTSVGACTFESIAYVARYITKKVNGVLADEHYKGKAPEYITMSRRPGIGHDWLMNHLEIYNYDEVVIRNGLVLRPPKYYDKIFDNIAPEFMEEIKDKRKLKALEAAAKNEGRLEVKEQYKLLASKRLLRSFEKEL